MRSVVEGLLAVWYPGTAKPAVDVLDLGARALDLSALVSSTFSMASTGPSIDGGGAGGVVEQDVPIHLGARSRHGAVVVVVLGELDGASCHRR